MRDFRDLVTRHEREQAARDLIAFGVVLATTDNTPDAAEIQFRHRYPDSAHTDALTKAAVTAMSTGALTTPRLLSTAFLDLLRPRTVLGRLVGTRPAPANVMIPAATSGAFVAWSGEGVPTPVGALGIDSVTLGTEKIAGIVPITRELATATDDDALALIERDLLAATAAFSDRALLDPSLTAVAGVRPASITSDADVVTFDDAEQAVTDLFAAVSSGEAIAPTFITSPTGALYLATVRATDGTRLFPDVGLLGGTLLGVPLLVSSAVQGALILVDADALLVADRGVAIDGSEQATLQMSDTPADSAAGVSLWQNGLVGIRVTRYVSWALGRAHAVASVALPLGSPS
jgi:HK97 family phage major capsid protein